MSPNNSPELNRFYDAISEQPTDFDSIAALINQLENPEDRERALQAIDEAQAISLQDRNALKEVLSGNRNAVSPNEGRNVSAWTPEQHQGPQDTLSRRTGIQGGIVAPELETQTNQLLGGNLILGGNLRSIDISNSEALRLAHEMIGEPLTSVRIRAYQESHNIGIDGKIGKETYLEMYAEGVKSELIFDMRDNRISAATQAKIRKVLTHGNLNGLNVVNLLREIAIQKERLEESHPNYESEYGSFFVFIDSRIRPVRSGEHVNRAIDSIVETSVIRELATEIIGEPLNETRVQEYQQNHNIDADGILGSETYYEMLADKTLDDITTANISENGLNGEIQANSLRIVRNANLSGSDTQRVIIVLQRFKEEHHSDADFTSRYGEFYAQIEASIQRYEATEEGQRVLREAEETRGRSGRSLYAIMTDENLPISERITEVATDPLLLTAGAIMFIFGVFGSNTRFTDSFWKRIGIVLGGALFGPTLINHLGIGEALEDLNDYTGATERLNTTFDRMTGSPSERIIEVRGTEGSELNRLFPDETLLDGTLEHFENTEALNTLSLDSLTGYITSLRSGETESLPDFLQNISINGAILSPEQIAVVLESLLASRRGNDSLIRDLFENISTPNLVGGILTGAGLVGGLIGGFPALATLTLAGGLGTLAITNHEEIFRELGIDDLLSIFGTDSQYILGQIDNEALQLELRNIIGNPDSSIENTISELQSAAERNPNYTEKIKELIDARVRLHIKSLNLIIQNIQGLENLSEARESLSSLNGFIEDNVTNPEIKSELLSIISERVNSLEQEEDERPLREARTQVESLEGDILAIQGNIDVLISERDTLISERSSADAERLSEIDIRLADIPREISALESQLRTKQADLDNANITLANLEVVNSIPVIQAHREYFDSTLQNAINTQGIITAVNINADTIISVAEQIQTIREQISPAEDSETKRELTTLIENVVQIIERTKSEYRDNFANMNITSEELENRNIDLSSPEEHENYMVLLGELSNQNISEELQTFLGVTVQSAEEIREIFEREYLRQIQEVEANFVATPANNVQNLQQTLQKRTEMIERYTSSFEVNYENTEFQDIIARKRLEIDELHIEDIEGFSSLYTETINNLTATNEEKNILLRVLELNPNFSDLRIFYTQQIPTLTEISEDLERTLSRETLEIFERYITL